MKPFYCKDSEKKFGLMETTKDDFPGHPRSFFSFIFTFIILFLTWILLSGRFDLPHLTMGIISSLIVSYISSDLLILSAGPLFIRRVWPRFIVYILYLLWEILLANLHMLYLTFHPNMKKLISPQIIKFQGHLTNDLSITTLANSITLTPGTVTIEVSPDGIFTVHAIDDQTASCLPGTMRDNVAKTFGE